MVKFYLYTDIIKSIRYVFSTFEKCRRKFLRNNVYLILKPLYNTINNINSFLELYNFLDKSTVPERNISETAHHWKKATDHYIIYKYSLIEMIYNLTLL